MDIIAISLGHSLASGLKMEDAFGSDEIVFCNVPPVVVLKKPRLDVIKGEDVCPHTLSLKNQYTKYCNPYCKEQNVILKKNKMKIFIG